MTTMPMRLTVIALLLSFMTTAYGQDSPWYVTPSAVWTNDDPDRAVADEVGGFQVAVGYDWTDRISVEGVLGYSSLTGFCRPGDCYPDQDHLDISLNVLAFHDRDSRFAPYLMAGIGYLGVDADEGPQFVRNTGVNNNPSATIGLGFKWQLGQSRFSVRGEYRGRFAFDWDTLADTIATIGVQYAFGTRSRAIGVPVRQGDRPADTDGDGVLDMWDDCPDTPAGVDVTARGCEIRDMSRDEDGDRVPDYRDECPGTAVGAPVGPTGCTLDSDMDGVLTGQDRCPATRPGATVDQYGCELDLDADRDGVPLGEDRCPDTRPRARIDVYGCEIRDIITLPGVNFESGSDRLLPGAENLMRDAARTLNRYPDLVVEVAGHTDNVGNADLNLGLSDRRARTVLDHLIEFGVDPKRLTSRGYGDLMPIADNATPAGRAANRRVELRVISAGP